MKTSEIIRQAIAAAPGVVQYLTPKARIEAMKAAPITRDEFERRLSRLIAAIDRLYLRQIEESAGALPFDFWQRYEADLRKEIATPLRGYIEQSFGNYSDYVNFIDRNGAIEDIDTAMTRAITEAARGIADTTRRRYQDLLSQGITQDEVIERMALRFSSGHAEQVAVTELTRAESQFSEALSGRLAEQGVTTIIRWLTAEDEKVCPICAPLDHKPKKDGGWISKGQQIAGPPAHPNCRCAAVVELTR